MSAEATTAAVGIVRSAYDRMATAPCPAFRWIGQPLSSCDRCGRPYWFHSHEDIPAPFAGGGRDRRRVITAVLALHVLGRYRGKGVA